VTKKKDPADYLPTGRPSDFTQDTANAICIRLAGGESLRSITEDPTMPSRQTIYSWMNARPSFLDQYVRAREEQAESMADEIVAIADETPDTAPVFDKDGNQLAIKLDSSYIQWQKNRIDARKWTAAKLRPKKYGDRIVHAGDDENPVVLENNLNVFGELLKSMKMARQSE
jgi:hypothetical protein